MGGVAVTRATGDGFTSPDGSDSSDAVKNYIILNLTPVTTIMIAPSGPAVSGPVPFGTSVFDTTTLTLLTPGVPATGTVTYTLTGPLPATAPASWTIVNATTWTETVTVGSNSTVPPSDPTGPLGAGSFSFSAAYTPAAGSSYGPATSAPEPLTVSPPPATPALTWGFWKNHTGFGPQADAWPVGTFNIAPGVTYIGKDVGGHAAGTMTFGGHTYSFSDLQAILATPVRGDALINLGHQLIAAILNVANGADPSGTLAVPLIKQASDLLATGSATTPGPLVIGVNHVTQGSDPALYAALVGLAGALDTFNSSGV
jgi:hypothetical protein